MRGKRFTSRSSRRRVKRRRTNKKSRKYSKSKISFAGKVMDAMNPPASITAETIASFPIPVNKKRYVDASSTAQNDSSWTIQGELSLIITQLGQATNTNAGWPTFGANNRYRVRKNVVYYEVTNLSNSPIFIRPIHWVAKTATSLNRQISILGIWDEFCLTLSGFPNEGVSTTALMNYTSTTDGYTTDQVLSSAFDYPEFKAYCKRWFTIKRGKTLLVPPQGQLTFLDRIKPFNFTGDYYKARTGLTTPGTAFDQNLIPFKSRGFIFECVGETARGTSSLGPPPVPSQSHAVALPGYVSVHRKFYFEAQPYNINRRTHAIVSLSSIPVLNATPVVFGSENNAAIAAV